MQRFTDLRVWERAHALTLEIYGHARSFPYDERFGLTSQLRRAAVSVPTNIAEGSKRRSNAEYARFLNVAEASLVEVEYLLLLARDLEYLSESSWTPMQAKIAELQPMLATLRQRVAEEA
jgi:four helix bundle protein